MSTFKIPDGVTPKIDESIKEKKVGEVSIEELEQLVATLKAQKEAEERQAREERERAQKIIQSRSDKMIEQLKLYSEVPMTEKEYKQVEDFLKFQQTLMKR